MLARLVPRPETRNLSPQVYPTRGFSNTIPTESTNTSRRIKASWGSGTKVPSPHLFVKSFVTSACAQLSDRDEVVHLGGCSG
jgi:hypothetical protein